MNHRDSLPVSQSAEYTEAELLRIAKRIHNTKRQYLLVNPLQAKHMPVSPLASLQMMQGLGARVSAFCGDARLVIGFAETATAIGAVVAHTLSPDCSYIQTTRESLGGPSDYILFSEEHSHVTTQKLAADDLEAMIRQTQTVVFVDDEFSTGKTLLNMIARLRERFPILSDKTCVAASVISRLSQAHRDRWAAAGIECVSLLQLPNVDYERLTAEIAVESAKKAAPDCGCAAEATVIRHALPDPRRGLPIGDYYAACRRAGDRLRACAALSGDVLVLGTEECMIPALLIGAQLERSGSVCSVRCHATTRSPIGVSTQQTYPIQSGWKIRSFYDPGRETYLYNLRKYDTVVLVSDSGSSYEGALEDLCALLRAHGCRRVICMVGEQNA